MIGQLMHPIISRIYLHVISPFPHLKHLFPIVSSGSTVVGNLLASELVSSKSVESEGMKKKNVHKIIHDYFAMNNFKKFQT